MLYTQNLNGSQQLMEAALEPFSNGLRNALAARDELSLVKLVLSDRVAAYASARATNKMATVALAGDMMLEVAKDTIAQIEKVSRIEQGQSEVITREQLLVLVRQMSEMIHTSLEDVAPDRADSLVGALEGMVGIGASAGGSKLRERELLELMQASVPMVSRE